MSKDTGGPAFPVGSGDMRDPVGMTLRDYFAAKALPAHITAMSAVDLVQEEWDEEVARLAYRSADAMLAERSK